MKKKIPPKKLLIFFQQKKLGNFWRNVFLADKFDYFCYSFGNLIFISQFNLFISEIKHPES
jgi:hypothetical protein